MKYIAGCIIGLALLSGCMEPRTVVSVKQIGDYTVVTYKVSIEGKFNKQTTEKIFKCYYLTSSYKILTSKYKEPLSSQNSPLRKFWMAEVMWTSPILYRNARKDGRETQSQSKYSGKKIIQDNNLTIKL
jgi:hypothetical protein